MQLELARCGRKIRDCNPTALKPSTDHSKHPETREIACAETKLTMNIKATVSNPLYLSSTAPRFTGKAHHNSIATIFHHMFKNQKQAQGSAYFWLGLQSHDSVHTTYSFRTLSFLSLQHS